MDEFLIIKSKEDVKDLFLYIKRNIKEKNAVKYDYDGYHKIYIDKKELNNALEAFADFLIRNYAFFFIKDYLDSDFSLYDAIILSINNYQNALIIDKIKNDVEEFTNCFHELNIRGYLLFAFRKYEDMIMEAIGDVIDLYNAEEEYKRILTLISAYVDDGCPEIHTIHIIKKPDGNYEYYDTELNNIMPRFHERIKNELTENYTREDELLCVLINLRPENIFLHLNSLDINLNFLFTLEAIFGGRIKICTNGCPVCNS